MIPLPGRETSGYLRTVLSLAITISLGWWNIPCVVSAQQILLLQPSAFSSDSLLLRELEFNIGQAELEVTQTNVLHRLTPQIHFSAGIGLKEILFIDPSNTFLSYLPKDAYRLSITLPITDIFDDSRHRIAELKLGRLRAELTHLYVQMQRDQSELHRELASLEFIAGIDSAELSMKEEVLRFEDLRFSHGKIEYDDLVRSRLEVLYAKKSLYQLECQISAIRLKLRGHP